MPPAWTGHSGRPTTTLTRKLVLAFAIVLVLVGAQAALSVYLLTRVVEQSARLVSPALDRVDDLAHIEADILRLRTLEYSLIWSSRVDVRQQYTIEMAGLRSDIDQRLKAYAALQSDAQMDARLADLTQSYHAYLGHQQIVIDYLAQGRQDEALWEYLRYQPSFQNLDDQVHGLRHQEYAVTEQLRDQMVQSVIWARVPLGILVFLVAAAEIGLGWHVSRRVAQSLEVLLHGARRIADEDFATPVPPPAEPELATLAETLNAVMTSLASHNAERARLEEERSRANRERLSQVIRAQEDERARISRELHDQAAQSITALRYGLGHIQRITNDAEVAAEVERLIALAAQTSRQISALARDLRPSVLDDLGLGPALRSYARDFSERFEVPVQVSLPSPLPRLLPDAETAVFRVVQEALINVAKHAQARHVWVALAVSADNLCVEIRDDGRGFEPKQVFQVVGASTGAGLGLMGIRERVHLLGGQMGLTSEVGRGTQIKVAIPLSRIAPVALAPRLAEVAN